MTREVELGSEALAYVSEVRILLCSVAGRGGAVRGLRISVALSPVYFKRAVSPAPPADLNLRAGYSVVYSVLANCTVPIAGRPNYS